MLAGAGCCWLLWRESKNRVNTKPRAAATRTKSLKKEEEQKRCQYTKHPAYTMANEFILDRNVIYAVPDNKRKHSIPSVRFGSTLTDRNVVLVVGGGVV